MDEFLRFLSIGHAFPKKFSTNELLEGMSLERNQSARSGIVSTLNHLQKIGLTILPSKRTRRAIYRFNIAGVERVGSDD